MSTVYDCKYQRGKTIGIILLDMMSFGTDYHGLETQISCPSLSEYWSTDHHYHRDESTTFTWMKKQSTEPQWA